SRTFRYTSLLVTTTPAEVRATPPSGLIFASAAACACLSTRWSSTRPHIALKPCAVALLARVGSLEPGWSVVGDIGFLLTSRRGGRAAAPWNSVEGIFEEKQVAQVLFWAGPICKLRLRLAAHLRNAPRHASHSRMGVAENLRRSARHLMLTKAPQTAARPAPTST